MPISTVVPPSVSRVHRDQGPGEGNALSAGSDDHSTEALELVSLTSLTLVSLTSLLRMSDALLSPSSL